LYRSGNPVLFFLNEAGYFRNRRIVWRANLDFRVVADLQRNRFSSFFASIDRVGDIHEKIIASCRYILLMLI
jgi:hypothetical protein